MVKFLAAHPEERNAALHFDVLTDGRSALASVPFDSIGFVGRRSFNGELLAPALLFDRHGRPRERWSMSVGDGWTVDLVLDGDRIAAVALRHAMPPPF